MRNKPVCLKKTVIASSRLFNIEQLALKFENGEYRVFERIRGQAHGAVMIVPMLDDDTFFLVREYAAGLDRYEITLPKGLMEKGEGILETANRELQEEIGYGARDLTLLKAMSTSPGHMTGCMHVVLARDLYASKLPGDEPEELEVIKWSLKDLDTLLAREDFTEARSIAGLLWVKQLLSSQ